MILDAGIGGCVRETGGPAPDLGAILGNRGVSLLVEMDRLPCIREKILPSSTTIYIENFRPYGFVDHRDCLGSE